MIASAVIVGQISMDIETIVMVSLGLSAISLIGLLIAVFTGVGLGVKGDRQRTLHASAGKKPLRRWEFLLGKFTGLVLTLTVNTAAMGAGLFLAMWYVKHSIARGDTVVLVAVYFILLKLTLVVALAMMFSCFTSPLLAILFTGGLYVAGLFVAQLRSLQVTEMSPHTQKFFAILSFPVAKLWKLRRDGGGGAWARDPAHSGAAQYAVHGAVLRDRAERGRGNFFPQGFEVMARKIGGVAVVADFFPPAWPASGDCSAKSILNATPCTGTG